MTFDKFEPWNLLQMIEFDFEPSYFELWMNGNMLIRENTKCKIIAEIFEVDEIENVLKDERIQRLRVTFNEPILYNELTEENVFDVLITSHDRLQYLIVPNKTDKEHPSFAIAKMAIGATRFEKNFKKNEPYCCNLFLYNFQLAKVTFAFSNPEKLIEFYN